MSTGSSVEYRPEHDLYLALKVPDTATPEEIKRAHRTLIRELHPDKECGDHERAVALNRARDVLLDPVARENYDVARRQHLAQAAADLQRRTMARWKRRRAPKKPASASAFAVEAPVQAPAPIDVRDAFMMELRDALEKRQWGRALFWGLLGFASEEPKKSRARRSTRRRKRRARA
jgi:curved DNA-binding protein CbpA